MGRRSGLLAGDRFVGYGIFTELQVHSDGLLVSCRVSARGCVKIGKVDCKAMRVVLLGDFCSQAKEGMWGMPGHTEARKAVVSCEKLGGVAHTR